MMARLYPVLPIHPDETHRSWAARLAAFHIGAPVTELFEDMNIDPLAYALGAPDEVENRIGSPNSSRITLLGCE
ncbi:hypothetical protein [Rhodobacter sp. 24-YEA-8]|uniref:hypothetical protein n=1 Tax=Rhodobacter sp. 24-YEA-8 TaxID=1884310 RepID=UPI0008985AFE|nr:hypothetical protein [Rhodobacter sp. 24-YEA-8]SED18394.1 hypothetical protein SAMN05519105_3553 [Rhodobacter sp. 24-YEA-8]